MPLSEELGLKKKEATKGIIVFKKEKEQEKFVWDNPEFCLKAVKQNGWALQHVKEQTPEVCLEAVKQSSRALQFVKEQTPELCLIAVKKDGCALGAVKEQTYELCLEAVKQNGWALKYVKKQTPELCLIAVKENSRALEHIKEQTLELIQIAIKQDKYAANYIDTNVLPIKDWGVEWFEHLFNVELKRQFIRERGKEIFQQLDDLEVITEDDEYCLVKFKYTKTQRGYQKALIFKCPSTNDVYFTEVSKEVKTIKKALKFLNNGVSKEELAYES